MLRSFRYPIQLKKSFRLVSTALRCTKVTKFDIRTASTSSRADVTKGEDSLSQLKSRGLHNDYLTKHIKNTKINDVSISEGGRYVDITWEDGHVSKYHAVWLRHNCHCPDCRLDFNGMIKIDFRKLGENISVTNVELDGDEVAIFSWSSTSGELFHKGPIPTSWLREYCYSKQAEDQRRQSRAMTFFSDRTIPTLNYHDVMDSDAGLYNWLTHLSERGICLIKEAPKQAGHVTQIAKRIAPIQHTVYGETFHVNATPQPINAAYSSVELNVHMDQTHYEAPPGIQLLHCIQFDQDIKGGDNTFVDVHEVAHRLRREKPEYFQILTRVPITAQTVHYDRDYPVHLRTQRPVISLNHKNDIVSVIWHPMLEGPLQVDFDDVEPFYEAYKYFFTMVNCKEEMYSHRMVAGDIITCNNRRVLHGRAEFSNQTGMRHLEGTYVESSEFQSRVRVFNNILGNGKKLCRIGNSSWE